MRGWTLLSDEDDQWEQDYDGMTARCNALASLWDRAHQSLDGRALSWEQEREDYDWEDWELESARAQKHALDAGDRAVKESVEEELAKLGARMMRPYEHWNEDEAYMEYMERTR